MKKNSFLLENLKYFSTSYPNVIDLSLNRVFNLLCKLDNPHLKLPPIIHVAGTNGKGSTIAFIASILQSAGKSIHIYTSPHLSKINERIVISNNKVTDEVLYEALNHCVKINNSDPITQFELLTCVSFHLMSQHFADLAIIETGLGGRLDATNVHPNPLISVITSISRDHEKFLGNKIEQIAREKGGIIKKKIKCISSFQLQKVQKELTNISKNNNAELLLCGRNWNYEKINNSFRIYDKANDLNFPLPKMNGLHQIENAALAAYTAIQIKSIGLSKNHIEEGIINAKWPARLEEIHTGYIKKIIPMGYKVWIDGGHNVSAAKVINDWIKTERKKHFIDKFILICSFSKTKNAVKILNIFRQNIDEIIFLEIPQLKNFYSNKELSKIATNLSIKNSCYSSIDFAIKSLKPVKSGKVLIFGSLYLAGEIIKLNDSYMC